MTEGQKFWSSGAGLQGRKLSLRKADLWAKESPEILLCFCSLLESRQNLGVLSERCHGLIIQAAQ